MTTSRPKRTSNLSIAIGTLAVLCGAAVGCFSSTSPSALDAGGDDAASLDATNPPPGSDAAEDAAPDAAADVAPETGALDADADAAAAEDASETSSEASLAADAPSDASADGANADATVLVPGPYTINGAITGQKGSFILQDDGTDDLDVTATAHTFHFVTALAAGEGYAVTVLTQPTGQFCSVSGGTGTIGDASVGNIIVSCGIAPPSDLAVTAGPESVTLTWTAVPGASSYNLYDGPVSQLSQATIGSPTTYGVSTTGTTTLSATVTGLSPGTNYFFFLTSVDSQSHESFGGSNVVEATVVPLPPAVVTETPGNGQITLTWDSVQDATTYDVYYATTSDVTGGTKVSGAVSGVPITGLTNDQTYYFRVTALAATTEGPMSNEVSATPASALLASIASVANLGVVHSGAIAGRASGVGLSAVQVSLDSGPFVAATGTASWSFKLPTGASTWHDGSLHTVAVRATDGSAFSSTTTISVRKGTNQDLNADGYPDMAIGDVSAHTVSVFESAGPTGIPSEPTSAATVTLTSSDSSFGGAVLLADLDSDGYADVVASDGCNPFDGGVYIFVSAGSALTGTLPSSAVAELTSTSDSCFGNALAAGDIDGDGYADLVVGAEGYTNPIGYAYIFKSSASGIAGGAATTATATLTGPTLSCNPACTIDEFGAAIAVGDVNGDGYADVAVSALQSTGAFDEVGSVYVFYSAGASGISTKSYASANAVVTGPGPSDSSGGSTGVAANFGGSVEMGDVNGDGYADLVVGATFAGSTNSTYWEDALGAVYVFESSGSAGITSAAFGAAAVTLTAPLPTYCCDGVELGFSTSVGDINGDGYADVVATTRLSDTMYIFQSQGAPIATGDLSTASTVITGTSSYTETAVADVNGDGFGDVLAAAGGAVYVFESVGSGPIPGGGSLTANIVLTPTSQDLFVAP